VHTKKKGVGHNKLQFQFLIKTKPMFTFFSNKIKIQIVSFLSKNKTKDNGRQIIYIFLFFENRRKINLSKQIDLKMNFE